MGHGGGVAYIYLFIFHLPCKPIWAAEQASFAERNSQVLCAGFVFVNIFFFFLAFNGVEKRRMRSSRAQFITTKQRTFPRACEFLSYFWRGFRQNIGKPRLTGLRQALFWQIEPKTPGDYSGNHKNF